MTDEPGGDFGAAWGAALAALDGTEIGPQQRAFLMQARPLTLVEDTAVVAVPSDFARIQLEQRLRPMLVEALGQVLGRPVDLAVSVAPTADELVPVVAIVDTQTADVSDNAPSAPGIGEPGYVPQHAVPEPPRRSEAEQPRLNPRYAFETFVIGSSNRFAHAAAVAVAEAPGKAYNPLLIYGDSGLGKTHLLHAIGHYVRTIYP
ncbi:MAG: DnaA ATPase domain-containing protein, partial [Stackebrandtia sp.]